MLCLFLQVIGRYKKNVKPILVKIHKKKKKFLKPQRISKKRNLKGQVQEAPTGLVLNYF